MAYVNKVHVGTGMIPKQKSSVKLDVIVGKYGKAGAIRFVSEGSSKRKSKKKPSQVYVLRLSRVESVLRRAKKINEDCQMPHSHKNIIESVELDTISAAWLVSYCHDYLSIGKCGSKNWKKSVYAEARIKRFEKVRLWVLDGKNVKKFKNAQKSETYLNKHKTSELILRYWFRQILGMCESNMYKRNGELKNDIGLDYQTMILLASSCYSFL